MKTLEIPALDGLTIKVHEDGRIETPDRKNLRSNGRWDNRRGRVLKPGIDQYGYERVVLTKNGKRKSFCVHRLVATTYLENPENKPTVNHIDGDKTNNHILNLEWATQSEQKKHSIRLGLADKNILALENHNVKISIPIKFRGVEYPSIRKAARTNGVNERVVKREGERIGNEK